MPIIKNRQTEIFLLLLVPFGLSTLSEQCIRHFESFSEIWPSRVVDMVLKNESEQGEKETSDSLFPRLLEWTATCYRTAKKKKGQQQLLHLYNRSGMKMMKTEKMGNGEFTHWKRVNLLCALRFEEKPKNLLCKLLPWMAIIFAWGQIWRWVEASQMGGRGPDFCCFDPLSVSLGQMKW